MLPFLGVNRNIKRGWRTLHRSFLGIGLLDFSTELMIQRVNIFLQHYDSPFDIGITLRATMELVQLEAGLADCPLNHPFHPIGEFVTHSWFRSFWRAVDRFQCRFFLAYPAIPFPRERDHVLTTFYLQRSNDPKLLYFRSFQRCRISVKAIFLSDITTPDGKMIADKYLFPSSWHHPPQSEYDFTEERPSAEDWANWVEFWHSVTYPGFVLPTSLGPWIHHSHRVQEWFYHPTADVVLQRTANGCSLFERKQQDHITRSHQAFTRIGPLASLPDLSDYKPCHVSQPELDSIILGSVGPNRSIESPTRHDLFSLLRSWGGDWMWEQLESVGNLSSVVESIKDGSAIWCTDGSFDRVSMPDICSAGWSVMDPISKSHIRGSFYEVSPDASAYRGELLGLTALHLVGLAVSELFGAPTKPNNIYCDNDRALGRAKLHRRRIPSGTKHGDCLRLLRNLRGSIEGFFCYIHIYGHADDKRRWHELTLAEKLNVYCDHLAALARYRAIGHSRQVHLQTLPRERAALFLNHQKQTGDITDAFQFHLGLTQAREFYTKELEWTADQFDSVDWASLHLTLAGKKIMYSLWLSKQASGWCGTRLQVSRMTPGADDRCPNCHQPEERSRHLNVCPSTHRTQQFQDSVQELSSWLNKEHTAPELAFWIPKYLLARNRVSFCHLPRIIPARQFISMSSQMKMVAAAQDKIGWTHFLEGKVTGHIRGMQQLYLKTRDCRMNGDDWIKQFISRLLKISHTQWIFRNISLHDNQQGHLARLRRADLEKELTRLHALDPRDVPEESQFLLDFDIDDLAEGDINRQEQWILAMQAARIAGMKTRGRSIRWAKTRRRLRRRRHDPPQRVFRMKTPEEAALHDIFPPPSPLLAHPRPHDSSHELLEPSNKRRKRRRKHE